MNSTRSAAFALGYLLFGLITQVATAQEIRKNQLKKQASKPLRRRPNR